jgi:hypothetical protein
MLIQVRGVLVHAMSGTELSRVRTEFRLRLPETINKSRLESRGRHCYAIKRRGHRRDNSRVTRRASSNAAPRSTRSAEPKLPWLRDAAQAKPTHRDAKNHFFSQPRFHGIGA